MSEFRMPSLGADMEAGTLVEWLKRPGDEVRRGDVIAVVETQKGAIEVEVFEDGRIEELLVDKGATVPVGTPLARIASAREPAETAPRRGVEAAPPATPVAATAPAAARPPAVPEGQRRRISPAARRLAREQGLDLESLRGTGPKGAVVSADLQREPPIGPPETKDPGRRDLREMRKAIAAAMAKSKREIPHYYLGHAIDLSAAVSYLQAANARRSPAERLLLPVLLVKATALALQTHKRFNGFYGPDGFVASDEVHVGTAVAVRGGGLIAPALHHANEKSLDQLMQDLRELVARARTGKLRSSDLSEPTVTVSSLGDRGVDVLYGVIYPPQVALLGFGAPATRPWCGSNGIEPRTVIVATLAADHRVSDGHEGALLLADIDRRLQEPEAL